MKILVLIHEFPPVGGGGGHVARDLCEGLADLGHELTVITADVLGGVPDEQDDSQLPYNLIRVKTLRRDPARASIPAMISFLFSAFWRALLVIRRWQPDLIHVHFAVPSGSIAWLISQLTGIPYIVTIHLGDIPGGTPKKTDHWFRYIKPFTYPIWKKAGKIIAVSSFSRQLALEHYQVPIDVIHNGVDLNQFQYGKISINDPPRIVFAGRFVPQKNPLMVIRTLAKMKDLEWELVMMGDGVLFEKVQEEVQLNGLEHRVKLPGWVTPADVKREFQFSDILFMPSLSEGLPVVGVQALASGLAFIVSDIGGFHDIVEDGQNGFKISMDIYGYDELFKEKLRELIISDNKLSSFRNKSKEMAYSFDLEHISGSYSQLFNEMKRS